MRLLKRVPSVARVMAAGVLSLAVSRGFAASSVNFDTYSTGDMTWVTAGTLDKEFLNHGNWSDSCGLSPGVVTTAIASGEYGGVGNNLHGSGASDAFIGACMDLLFDSVTGGMAFDVLAAAGCPVTVAPWVDEDQDLLFDQPETQLQAGVVTEGANLVFGLQAAGYGAVISSGVAAVPGKWYRIAAIYGPADPSGNRVVTMNAYNLTDGATVDFDVATEGSQAREVADSWRRGRQG